MAAWKSRIAKASLLWAISLLAVPSSMTQAQAQGVDRALLLGFCASQDIQGSRCLKAVGYRDDETCDVGLSSERHMGNFLVSGPTLLLVQYGSDCEPRANQFGGAALYELRGAGFVFRGFYPGFGVDDCVVAPGGAKQDRLICLSSFMGQGHIESGVFEYVLSVKAGNKPELSSDVLLRASSSSGAYGAETVDCKEGLQRISLAKLRSGPTQGVVAVEVEYADQQAVRQACAVRRKPKSAVVDPGPDHAFLGAKATKTQRFVIDLNSKQISLESEFRKKNCPNGVCS